MAARTLADRPLGVVLRPDHSLTGHCVLSWADLADQKLLWFPSSRNPNFSEGVLGHLAERGWTPRLRTTATITPCTAATCGAAGTWSRCGPRTPSAPRREWPGVRSRPTHRTNASSWPHRPTARGRLCSARSLTGPEYRRPQRTTVRAIVAWPPTRIRCSTPSW
ncbi:LysR substrate-binding domain-containing protein [Streptomyces sp. NPDC007971]|uniref:LysR substrate-binding domain-containing protein n=1 Tax=Streptomyces sp. NPDC007971 TaxID=3364799 RepID=UPI0036E12F5D